MTGDPAWDSDPKAGYAACMALARQRPDQAFERASQWLGVGGGAPARHCQAVALIGLDEPGEAARRLEELARQSTAQPRLAVNLLAQAGQAWLAAGVIDRALATQTAALGLIDDHDGANRPDLADLAPQLLIDRAITSAHTGRDDKALDDLSRVLANTPDRVEALVLRAATRRRLGNLPGALADADRAVHLEPANPEARLERGDVHHALGQRDAARADWRAALSAALAEATLAPATGPAAAGDPALKALDQVAMAARSRLQALDGGADRAD